MVRAFIYLVACALLSPTAQAAEAVLMVNLNYSSAELKALREVAKSRGQEVHVVPPESMIPQAEPVLKLRIDLEAKVKKLRPGWTKNQVAAALNEFQRKGSAAERDPGLTSALASDADQLFRGTAALAEAEKKLGPVEEQLRAKAGELKRKGLQVDTLVLSAHSDGSNLTGESSTRLSSGDIDRVRSEFPEIFSRPRHVLLLGCYALTETNQGRWRGDLFPTASMIAGFGVQAPSRWRDVAIQYITETLNTAEKLDNELIAKNSPLDASYVTRTFRKLSSVLNTQSVIDYCRTIVEGQPGSSKISCEDQWASFSTQANEIKQEYMDLRSMSSDPPDDPNGGVLRSFYNMLQNTCPAEKNPEIPGSEKAAAERYRNSMKESVIRLINWANVQKNFHTYYANDIDEVNAYLNFVGVRVQMPELEGNTGRIEFVKAHQAVETAITRALDSVQREKLRLVGSNLTSSDYSRRRELSRREAGLEEARKRFLALYRPLYVLRGDTTVSQGEQLDDEATLRRGGIPFNWIEGGTVLSPREAE